MKELETIRTALFTGQASAVKVDVQRAFVQVARRDWSVRTLDAWTRWSKRFWQSRGDTCTVHFIGGTLEYDGLDEDAARLAAARVVWMQLPLHVRMEIGECP